jgi:recombination protein RecT
MTQAIQTATGTGVAKKPKKPVEILKGVLDADSVKQQFTNALGKAAPAFIASVIDLFNTDSKLQDCNPNQVVVEALKAAVLKLPINKALGFAYIIPYENSKKDANGNWIKVLEPTFQMGYKGYIQLAMRTGQYRTLNADVVYEGELRKVSKLTGEIAFDGERTSDKVIGYFCYEELLNGFSKTLYMTVEQMAAHAKKYSKSIGRDVTVENLLSLANLPVQIDSKTVGWKGNFHAMGVKTVVRNLLSHYGYLSIEMQNAIANDEDYDPGEARDAIIQEGQSSRKQLDMASVEYEEVGEGQGEEEAEGRQQPEVDPGY